MSGDNPFDLNRYSPRPRAERAAEEITQGDLIRFFSELEAANKLWKEEPVGPRRAALGALMAVTKFAGEQESLAGDFTRALTLLAEELRNAPAPLQGNILPPVTRGQALEAGRRGDVNRLKASAAYVAKTISGFTETRGAACNIVADVLASFQFPISDYFENDGSAKDQEDFPDLPSIAARLEEWCKRYPQAINEPGRRYRELENARPYFAAEGLAREDTRRLSLSWLRDVLVAGGYTCN